MLPVGHRNTTSAALSPSMPPGDTRAADAASRPAANPDGLCARGSAPKDDAPPRTTMASLPADIHRHLGDRLDARSKVAFASTSKALHEAMAGQPSYGEIGKLFPAVISARTAADYAEAFTKTGSANQSPVRTEALETLALRFARQHPAMPPIEALAARGALIGALQQTPAGPGSGRALAGAIQAAFESVRQMTRAAHRLTVDPGDVAPADQQRMLEECEAVLEAATDHHIALNEVINTQGLIRQHDTMTRLVDECFGEASAPQVMQFATVMVPVRLAKLEAGSVDAAHVVNLLTHLAEAEARPSNLATLHAMEWAPMAAAKIRAALDAHGIVAAEHPALQAALRTITGAPA